MIKKYRFYVWVSKWILEGYIDAYNQTDAEIYAKNYIREKGYTLSIKFKVEEMTY